MPIPIFDLSFEQMKAYLQDHGYPSYRSIQIWEGLYKRFWDSPGHFTNIPIPLRTALEESFRFNLLTPVNTLRSSDGKTEKTLFLLQDGKAIEAVLMRYNNRNTICISTQVGCAMDCVFCATGQMGFRRNLSSGEIVAQVIYFAKRLQEKGHTLTNVVVMGMGEPFHNYNETMAAIDRLNDSRGFAFGARRFTISTVGLIPAIRRFASEKRQVNLAVSLHTVDDNLRNILLPVNRRYPIDSLLDACWEYVTMTGRRITFEWALISGVNDTDDQAYLLASKIKGKLCHVNAIPLNPTGGYEGISSSRIRANNFKNVLASFGVSCTVRLRRGIEIRAGCGQLME